MTCVWALVPLLCMAACGGGPRELDLTITFGAGVDAATQARIATFDIAASGDESFSEKLSLGRAPKPTERIVYRPLASSVNINVSIAATDPGGDVLANGAVTVELDSAGATHAALTLDAPTAPSDLGTADLSVVADLSVADTDLSELDAGPDMLVHCPDGAICRDFEDGPIVDPAGGSGNCVLSSYRAWHGTHSLYCNGATPSYIAPTGGPDAMHGSVGFRAYIFSAPPASSSAGYVGFYGGSSDSNFAYIGDVGAGTAAASYTSTGGTTETLQSTDTDDGRQWHCVELVFTPPNVLTYYIDGFQTYSATDFELASTAPAFKIGMPTVNGTSSIYSVFVDDVIWSYGRAGCGD